MRALRLSALAVVLLLAYFAQYIFDQGTLAGLYQPWMLARFPFLIRTTLWLPQDLYTLALWLMGGSALVFGLLVPAWPAAARTGADSAQVRTSARPSRSLLLLLPVAILLSWGWTGLPVRIDAATARFGLQAQALLRGGADWLLPGVTGAPQMAGLPLGLLTLLLGSAPAATHLLGLCAALVTVAATALLASELFVVSPQRRALGLLAAGFTLCSLAMLHFGRLAAWLPATAAGTAAAFLLLAGHRRQNRVLLTGSGLLVALACTLDRSGLIFLLFLLLWWPSLRFDEGRRGRLHLFTWSAALLVGLIPLLLAWLLHPQSFDLYLHGGAYTGGAATGAGDWWGNLLTTAATFFWSADAGPVFGLDGHFVASLVAPLFVLACGGLLMSMDRPLGWRMLSALAITLVFSSVTNDAAPDWRTLLPILPLVGVAVVFALERSAAFWDELSVEPGAADGAAAPAAAVDSALQPLAGGSSTAVLALGLLLAAAAATAADYYQAAARSGDPPSFTGRALATLEADAVAVLAASTPAYVVRLDDPIVQYAAGARANQALAVTTAALPASLPAGALVIIQGADQAALAAARTQYPQATLEVVRDLHANPQLVLLRIP